MPRIFSSNKGSTIFCTVSQPLGLITADGNAHLMKFQFVTVDRFSNYDTSTGLFTVTDPGDYLWMATFSDSGGGHQTNNMSFVFTNKNGAAQNAASSHTTQDGYVTPMCMWMDSCVAGDTLSASYAISWGSNSVTNFGPATMVIVKIS